MNLSEVDTAVKKLSALDTYKRLADENVKAEYMQSLMNIEPSIFNAAFAQFKATYKELPPICDIQNACLKLKGQVPKIQEECKLCGGRGYVEVEELRALRPRGAKESTEEYKAHMKPYAMCYRCTCKNAERWGKTFTDHCTIPAANTPWACIDEMYSGWPGGKQ